MIAPPCPGDGLLEPSRLPATLASGPLALSGVPLPRCSRSSRSSRPGPSRRPLLAHRQPGRRSRSTSTRASPTLFPVDDLKRCLVETMELEGVDACRYFGAGGPQEMQYGYLGLRQALAERMARRDGRNVGSDGVLLAQGSTDGLALAVDAFL